MPNPVIDPTGLLAAIDWQTRAQFLKLADAFFRQTGLGLKVRSALRSCAEQADLYGIGLDGKGLHRLTNAPSLGELSRYQKCKVAVTITNRSRDALVAEIVVYVVGASKPESVLVPPFGGIATVTFNDVAVIPDALQPVMAAFGGRRWPGGG